MAGEEVVTERFDPLPLHSDVDVVRARHRIREIAVGIGMDLFTQTKLITAASELGRNCWVHGGGGTVEPTVVEDRSGFTTRVGIRLTFSDSGPGIPDLTLALTSGWTTGEGLGLGLPGSQRLVHDFDLHSIPGEGTTVTVTMWRR